MKNRLLSVLLLVAILVAACQNVTPTPEIVVEDTPTAQPLPTAEIQVTSVPDAEAAVETFLTAWGESRYAEMHDMLTALAKDANPLEDFTKRYNNVSLAMALTDIDYQIFSVMTTTSSAQIVYRVTMASNLIEQYTTGDMLMDLVLEDGEWKIEWHDGLIMPQLRGGNRLMADVSVPARGDIYGANGEIFAAQTKAYAIGIQPDRIQNEGSMLSELSRIFGMPTADIQQLFEYARGTDWYVAVGDAPAEKVDQRLTQIYAAGGVWLNEFTARYYYAGESAAQVIGYVQPIPQESLDDYRAQGYVGSEVVGMSGIEKGSEVQLRGQRGADLYVVNPDGQVIDRLGHTDSYPALSVTTTLDFDFQEAVQRAMSGKTGAIVVLERDTGRVLAMASSPTFNPNLFNADNVNRNYQLNQMLSNPDRPTINRATQSGYPLGSVYKIITMAAALESGLFQNESMYYCGYTFEDLPGQVFYDWTWERGIAASGDLNLQEALMRSCNIYFYHIGLDLYRKNFPDMVSDMAKGFGLGSRTGIAGIDEAAGNVPEPQNEGDAVQLAIGQGTLQVTPLQVATFIAALGNGGTLYQPQLVEQYTDVNGNAVSTFTPIVNGQLPISEDTLNSITEAMRWVTGQPRGTAWGTFSTLRYPVYAKTGTAQTSVTRPHSWFAGYTDANIPGKPDIAIAVIAEYAGEGSEVAAPIFRRVVELYFEGRATRVYPWESRVWVTQTPTLLDIEYTQTAVQQETREAEREATRKAEEEEAENNGNGE